MTHATGIDARSSNERHPPQASSALAPIALFIFKRPTVLRQTIESLATNPEFEHSPIVVFGDGPRNDDDAEAVNAAREVAQAMLGERARYEFSPVNRGLAKSIVEGVGSLVREHGRAIVIEDDLLLAPGFLAFMNGALDRYADDPSIFQVSGHNHYVPELTDSRSAVILPFTTTQGWGVWDRSWRRLDINATGWETLKSDRSLRRRFNLDGAYDYSMMLERQMRGNGNSWGILWYWTVFKSQGHVVFPPKTLVYNLGMDSSGTNGRGVLRGFADSYDPRGKSFPTEVFDYPDSAPDPGAYSAVRRAVWKLNGGQLGRAIDWAKLTALRLGLRR